MVKIAICIALALAACGDDEPSKIVHPNAPYAVRCGDVVRYNETSCGD